MAMIKTMRTTILALVAAACFIYTCFNIKAGSIALTYGDMEGFIETNGDFCGILEIRGLLREPVVQGRDNSYYLSHGFDGSEDRNGCLFADAAFREGCTNLVIYGHNSFNGTAFSDLIKYKNPDFAAKHPRIIFTNRNCASFIFRIAMILNFSVDDITTCDPFQPLPPAGHLERCRPYARYYVDESIQAVSTSGMLTLSTCDETVYGSRGRLIIIAVREG